MNVNNRKILKNSLIIPALLGLIIGSFGVIYAATSTITGLVKETDDLSTLETLVGLAKLGGALDDSSAQYTVFAPKNSAFSALPKEVTDALVKPENEAVLAGILKYHVIPSKILSTDLKETQEVTTLNGEVLTVKKVDGKVTITDKTGSVSTVVTADVEATNGVAHIVDKVLLDKAYSFPATVKKLHDTGVNILIPTLAGLLIILSSGTFIYNLKVSKK